jgi:hypothetical protein
LQLHCAIVTLKQRISAVKHFPFFFSLDGKETKDQALAARRPFTAL